MWKFIVSALALYGGFDLAQTFLAGRETRLGGRNIGSIQEAIMWEEEGFPSQTSMNPKHYRR